MAVRGLFSVEVSCTNDALGDMAVNTTSLGAGCSWIAGESASDGGTLGRFTSATWGVFTNEPTGSASGQVELSGLGSAPAMLSFSIAADGASQCTVSANDAVQAIVTPVDTGETGHVQFTVQLIPK